MKVRKLQGLIVGFSLVFSLNVMSTEAIEYEHEVVDKKISFSWKVDGDNLAIKLAAETEGWVGIGFNPTNEMEGGNFILGYVKKGKAKIIDDYGYDKNKHKSDTKLDGTKDVTLIEGTEIDGLTTIEFTMPLDSGDKNDNLIEVDGDTTVLLAYGAGRDSFRSKHKYRSTLTVNLSTGASEKKK